MTRNEAIDKIDMIIKRANEYSDAEGLLEIYIFGSLSIGSKDPNDCDILLIFESDREIIYTKKEKILRNKFGGRISKVDMIICSSYDFHNNYSFVFKKESLIKIWEKETKIEWKKIIIELGNDKKERQYIKPIQSKLFKMYPATIRKIEFAFLKNIIQIREIKASDYIDIKEKWICGSFSFDEDGNKEIEEFDEYEIMIEYLSDLEKNKISKSYIRTLKLMYIFAYKNDHYFNEYYNNRVKFFDNYETHFYTEDKKTLYIIYNPNFENIFYILENDKSIRSIIVIPWVRARGKENYIYEIKRGKNWRKVYLEKLKNFY